MSFVENTWYMAMWAQDLKDTPVARRIIDRPLVLFRTAQGDPVALADACPHRFAPLHMGKIMEDGSIRCAYHGLQFDASGACVRNPHPSGRIPPLAKVRAYPVVEKHTMLWIWMGERAPDHGSIPDFNIVDRADPALSAKKDFVRIGANYVLITENLLDLSHAAFLHEGVLGNSDTLNGKIVVEQDADTIWVRRSMPNVRIPGLYDLLFRRDGSHVDMWADIRWNNPGCLLHDSGVKPPGGARGQGTGIFGIHVLTPESEQSTVYHFFATRQSPVSAGAELDETIRHRLSELRRQAFVDQDFPMIEAQQRMMNDPSVDISRPALFEIDAGPSRFQRRLSELLRSEGKTAASGFSH
jgi:phenylpropionate dioxygenase-like ring-hydroxylating dioxygenase large terminal subunit